MTFLLFAIISVARVGFLSETDDAWSNKMEKTIKKTLYEMKRFKIIRAEPVKELQDSSRDYIVEKLNLDYLIVGNLEGVESDIKVYPDIKDTIHGGYKRVAVAEMYYELKVYQRGKREPSWERFVGSGEEEWGKIEDAEEDAYRESTMKLTDYLINCFALKGRITDKKGRMVKIDLGKRDGVRRGMVFVAKGKRGHGFFKISDVDDTAKGYVFKGVSRIRRGYPVKECPHGVSFLYVDLGYIQYRTQMDDSIRYPYGIFTGLRIGRRLQFAFEGSMGFGHIFFPSIGLYFSPLAYLGEDLAFGPLIGGEAIFAFQSWRSDDGGLVLGDSSGIAKGYGFSGEVGAVIRYDINRIHLIGIVDYPFATTISGWDYSREISGERQSMRVPDHYLKVGNFRFKDFIIKIGLGYNFEIY